MSSSGKRTKRRFLLRYGKDLEVEFESEVNQLGDANEISDKVRKQVKDQLHPDEDGDEGGEDETEE